MTYELPKLSYEDNALEPIISKKTIEFHYGKHLQTYITNLNNLIKGQKFEDMPLEEIIKNSDGGVFNNAAQTWNHIFYFNSFAPKNTASNKPTGKLLEDINKKWGTFEKFKEEFSTAAISIFGSGWAWLSKDSNGELVILKESNAGTPLTKNHVPILCFDVWEHAYYIDFQNRRADHINSLWEIINWDVVSSRY